MDSRVVTYTEEKPLEKPLEKPRVKPLEKTLEKPLEKPLKKPLEKPLKTPLDDDTEAEPAQAVSQSCLDRKAVVSGAQSCPVMAVLEQTVSTMMA